VILAGNIRYWTNPVAQTAAELCSQQLEYFVPHTIVFQRESVITETCSFAMEVRNLRGRYSPDFILSNEDRENYGISWSPFEADSFKVASSPWIYHTALESAHPETAPLLYHGKTCILFKDPPQHQVL
jgi:hypothetical protein